MKQGMVGFLLGVILSISCSFLAWPLILAGVGIGAAKMLEARNNSELVETKLELTSSRRTAAVCKAANEEFFQANELLTKKLKLCQSKGK